jgi:G3E family GTPase
MKKQVAAGGRTPAVLVTGLPASGKSAFIRRYADSLRGCAEIVTVDDADVLAARMRKQRGHRPLVIEARGGVEPLDLIEVFAEGDAAGRFRLAEVVAVVDAPRFLPLFREEAADDGPEQTAIERLVNHIEHASAVALGRTDQLRDAADQVRIADLVRALNPTARLASSGWQLSRTFDLSRPYRDASWLAPPPAGSLASGSIDVVRYQARRPFDSGRLAAVLDAGWSGVLRSKGFVWIASRGEERGVYLQAGRTWRLADAGPWWASVPQQDWPEAEDEVADIRAAWNVRTGDRRQELLLIGMNLRPESIRRDLDACLLGSADRAHRGATRAVD